MLEQKCASHTFVTKSFCKHSFCSARQAAYPARTASGLMFFYKRITTNSQIARNGTANSTNLPFAFSL